MKREYTVHARKSPLWKLWKLLFPDADMSRMFMGFGRRIFIPEGTTELPDSMRVHEIRHLEQQGFSYFKAVLWWIRYKLSKKFRFEQELEAYQEQVEWFANQPGNMFKRRHQYCAAVADVLSSPMYGSIVSQREAFKALAKHAGIV